MAHVPTLLMLFLAASAFEVGSLFIETQPGVEVVWEGVLLGSTDARGNLTIDDSPLGVFTITLRKPGFRTVTTEVEIVPGRKTWTLELEPILTPADSPPRPAVTAAATDTPPNPSGEEPDEGIAMETATSSSGEVHTATAESVVAHPGTSHPEPTPPRPVPGAIAPGAARSVLTLLGAVILGAIVLALVRRLRPRPSLPAMDLVGDPFAVDPPSEGPEPFTGAAREHTPSAASFLEDLKRRERALEGRGNAGAGVDEDIIDVEVTEVRPGELTR